jgi:hypothetical protein
MRPDVASAFDRMADAAAAAGLTLVVNSHAGRVGFVRRYACKPCLPHSLH